MIPIKQKSGYLIGMLYTWFGSIEILFVSLTEPLSAKRIVLHLAIKTYLRSVPQLYLSLDGTGAFTTRASRGVKIDFTTLSPILGMLVKLRSSAMFGLHSG